MSELIYTVCLIGYMQAMPLKLIGISVVVNVGVFIAKYYWRW